MDFPQAGFLIMIYAWLQAMLYGGFACTEPGRHGVIKAVGWLLAFAGIVGTIVVSSLLFRHEGGIRMLAIAGALGMVASVIYIARAVLEVRRRDRAFREVKT